MRNTVRIIAAAIVIVAACPAWAGDKALVTSMRTVPCAARPSFMTMMAGAAAADVSYSCTEFTLRTDRVQLRVRPRKDVLLPVGDMVAVKLSNKEVLVRLDDTTKDIRCEAIEMTLLDAEGKPMEEEKLQRRRPSQMNTSGVPGHARLCLNTQTGDVVPCIR